MLYDMNTIEEFNMDSKAECVQHYLVHVIPVFLYGCLSCCVVINLFLYNLLECSVS